MQGSDRLRPGMEGSDSPRAMMECSDGALIGSGLGQSALIGQGPGPGPLIGQGRGPVPYWPSACSGPLIVRKLGSNLAPGLKIGPQTPNWAWLKTWGPKGAQAYGPGPLWARAYGPGPSWSTQRHIAPWSTRRWRTVLSGICSRSASSRCYIIWQNAFNLGVIHR